MLLMQFIGVFMLILFMAICKEFAKHVMLQTT